MEERTRRPDEPPARAATSPRDHAHTAGPATSSARDHAASGPATAPARDHDHTTPLLQLRDVRKSYGGVHALRGVDMQVSAPGTVHALIGENGSGKSTLLSILAGRVRADGGEVLVDGEILAGDHVGASVDRGIVMVSQETAVAGDLSVAENVLLGHLPRRRLGAVDWGRAHERAAAVIARLGLTCATTTLVRDLAPDERQMVEIARALSMDPRVLILDEPTSSLTADEVEAVLDAIRALKRQDVATILVSHRLAELVAVADEVTVLRDGRAVAAGRRGEFTADTIVTAMLGADAPPVQRAPASTARSRTAAAPVALDITGATGPGFADVSMTVRRGEVVGLAGLLGSGRSEVLRAVFGATPLTAGAVVVDGAAFAPADPSSAIRAGIGYVPPERKTEGLVLGMTVRENAAMAMTSAARSTPLRRRDTEFAPFDDIAQRLRLRRDSASAPAGTLSGGNQQKVVLAKWLAVRPVVLMLDEPTRGVDVGARAEIHVMLRELAAQEGTAVLVSSSENAELLELCDRIVVLLAGRVVGEHAADEIDEAGLAAVAGGHERKER